MKKAICFVLALAFAFLQGAAVTADSAALPTIDEALRNADSGQITEVADSLEEYSISNEVLEELGGDLRLIVLQREAPEKEFTENKVYPPFSDDDGFPEGFAGVDRGASRVWLRGDVMQQIPPDFRAASLADATYLLVAETVYEWDGTVSVADYTETDDGELPEFESAEEMAEYLYTHPREVESVTYYPKFGVYSLITLYETATGKFSVYDYVYTPSTRFAKNPQASDHWENMTAVANLLAALDEEAGVDLDAANEWMELLDFIPEEKKALWKSCIDAGETSTAVHSISEYWWAMAEELKNLDPSEENRASYDMIISERNALALQLFANYCEYAGFERAISSIEESGDYMAKADSEWLENGLLGFAELFGGN